MLVPSTTWPDPPLCTVVVALWRTSMLFLQLHQRLDAEVSSDAASYRLDACRQSSASRRLSLHSLLPNHMMSPPIDIRLHPAHLAFFSSSPSSRFSESANPRRVRVSSADSRAQSLFQVWFSFSVWPRVRGLQLPAELYSGEASKAPTCYVRDQAASPFPGKPARSF